MRLLLRAFTCLVVCFAVPGCAALAQDVVILVTGGECCDGNCDDGSTDCCPKTCAHCAHANAVTTPSERLVQTPSADVVPFFWWTEDASASGYRAPPFRPPSA